MVRLYRSWQEQGPAWVIKNAGMTSVPPGKIDLEVPVYYIPHDDGLVTTHILIDFHSQSLAGLNTMGKLENRVALVTGASSGMGKEIARLFAEEGASVVAVARHKEKLQGAVDGITAKGGKAIAVAGDVSKEEDVRAAVTAAMETYGRLDIVINNAGMMDRMDPVGEMDDETWNEIIDVNLTGPMRLFRAAIPVFLAQGRGVFVTTASLGGLFGCRAGAAYTASKHGVIGLAKNVAYMYAKKGIRSNIIAPGGVNTDITRGLTMNPGGAALCMAGLVTNPRIGEPAEIARVALFLASDDSGFVNGATLIADAGWSAY